MKLTRVLALSLAILGCDSGGLGGLLGDAGVGESPEFPTGSLSTVTLAQHPTNDELIDYYCPQVLNETSCVVVAGRGAAPEKESLIFSFETVFALGNPNTFAVPMVEFLLAITVFPGEAEQELGALCVSFCDPAATDCAATPPEEACREPGKDVSKLESYVPTMDDLVDLAREAVEGDLDENLQFRVIPARSYQDCQPAAAKCEPCPAASGGPDAGAGGAGGAGADAGVPTESMCCDGASPQPLRAGCRVAQNEQGETCALCDGEAEAHIRFDLGIDAITSILLKIGEDAIESLEWPTFDIPYSIEGTLFFDVPVLGRFAINFPAYSGVWSLD